MTKEQAFNIFADHQTQEEQVAFLMTVTDEELNDLCFLPLPIEDRWNRARLFLAELDRRNLAIARPLGVIT